MPYSYLSKVKALDGVDKVTMANWFGGYYQDKRNQFPTFPVDAEEYFDIYKDSLVLPPEQMQAWKAAYGMVDIEAELKRAAAWIVSNPHLAPKSQLGRFLNTWFAKGQDRASIRSIPLKEERQPKKACAYCSADATGSVAGILCCREHTRDAMDGKPRRMLGVVPKAVAGPD